jgi:hypothetical protein
LFGKPSASHQNKAESPKNLIGKKNGAGAVFWVNAPRFFAFLSNNATNFMAFRKIGDPFSQTATAKR